MMTSAARPRPRAAAHNHAEQAYREVRGRLVAGQFQPGDRLNEVDLSSALRMSRTPVREALRRLQSDGLVTATGRGVVVVSLSVEDMRHALAVHGALEVLAAELAATRQHDGLLAPAEISRLRATAAEVERLVAAGDLMGAWQANLRLHHLIGELSGNPLLVESLGRIWARFAIASLRNVHARARVTPHLQHQALVDAIAEGDPLRAAEAAREHGRQGTTTYLASLAEPGDGA